ncbi:KRAB-A domain-containing protein 2-like [Aedes albopictus]|uniref:Integrase catalytic domain-containing protein n=1 Tax=Aedes albopictus TaxID=7160 RepID=A0ABM1Y929_AEDAL
MIFRLFGVPEIILTDNGSQFVSRVFKDLLKAYGVNHWLTPAYHPQVNNTERVNRVITTAIRATLKKDHKHWAEGIQGIANAIRTAVHESTKYSPYFVVFGRNQVSDGGEYARIRDNYKPDEANETGEAKERKKLFEEVKANLLAAYKKHERTYNLRSNVSCPRYVAGVRVLKKTFDLSDKGKGFCKKLAPKFEPCVVRKVLGSHSYELEDNSGKRIGVFFADQLKKLNASSAHLSN